MFISLKLTIRKGVEELIPESKFFDIKQIRRKENSMEN